jgi:PRTRC genetic system protein E
MIKELDHILDTHEIHLVLKRDEPLKVTRVVVLPKLLGDGHPPKAKEEVNALLHPLVLTGTPEELDEELPDTLLKYVHVLKEGKDNMDAVEAEIKKAVDAKKKPAQKKAPAKKAAPKPKKPTKAELKEEARAKQAEANKGQADMFDEGGTRLDTADKSDDLDGLLEGI